MRDLLADYRIPAAVALTKMRGMTTASMTSATPPVRSDIRTISLVGLAHGSSHFFHLLLPPLFPWLIAEFDYSHAQLGVMVSLFYVVSGVGQMLSGFLVDKVGAQRVLFAALTSFVVAGLMASVAQNYAMLLAASLFAGLGNAPFHPVDFTILNKRVTAKHRPRVFRARHLRQSGLGRGSRVHDGHYHGHRLLADGLLLWCHVCGRSADGHADQPPLAG